MEDLVLNEYENMVALEVVAPEDIPVGFAGEYWKKPLRCTVALLLINCR